MYSGLPYDLIVYGGFLLDDEPATGQPPKPNVQDLDDSRGRLGCGEPQFFLTARCATSGVLCVLDGNVIRAKWDRRLDDISKAELVMGFGGDQNYTCCECLADAEPWCHELHIWRDGQEVWVGPIQEIEYENDTVTVRASDSLAWLNVRIPSDDLNFTVKAGTGPIDLSELAEVLLEVAFIEDFDNGFTCEYDNRFVAETGIVLEQYYEKFNQTAYEILAYISDAGLDFTTIGRTIAFFADTSPLTPLIQLTDEHIKGGLKVRKDGTLQGNRYYVHFEEDGGIPAKSEVAKYCYGPIERILDGQGLVSGIDAGNVAQIYAEAAGIAPRLIEMTPGSQLSPDTPWEINQMVPGARVDVAVTKLCLNLTQSFRLTNVEAEYTPDDGETIGITLTPINSVSAE